MIRSRTRAKGSLILLRVTQLLFGTTCVGVATVLIFQLGPARTVTHGTSMRVLGAALLAFAFGEIGRAHV